MPMLPCTGSLVDGVASRRQCHHPHAIVCRMVSDSGLLSQVIFDEEMIRNRVRELGVEVPLISSVTASCQPLQNTLSHLQCTHRLWLASVVTATGATRQLKLLKPRPSLNTRHCRSLVTTRTRNQSSLVCSMVSHTQTLDCMPKCCC
jgi:hypothetical protein